MRKLVVVFLMAVLLCCACAPKRIRQSPIPQGSELGKPVMVAVMAIQQQEG